MCSMFYSLAEIEDFLHKRKKIGIKPGLTRVKYLFKKMNHPEKYLSIIHVAGTNGKGSTIQFINKALIACNYQVGMFTSPSFTGVRGHFLINGVEISNKDLIFTMNELLPVIQEMDRRNMHPTEFEIITVLALLLFKNRTDIVLLETGMGGRYDTTNCVIPLLSVITNVEKDHMNFLGQTIEEITAHKAGIIKKNRPVVIGRVTDESEIVIKEEAKRKNAPIYQLGNDFSYRLQEDQSISLKVPNQYVHQFRLQLKGIHQIENASVALMVLNLLESENFRIDWQEVKSSLAKTKLPGRFEMIHRQPILILDSAHNVAGIKAFVKTVNSYYRTKEKHVLFAGFKDKQLVKMLHELEKTFQSITLTTFEHERAATIGDFVNDRLQKYYFDKDWKRAIRNMINKNSNAVYFVTGSLHFITMVRKWML